MKWKGVKMGDPDEGRQRCSHQVPDQLGQERQHRQLSPPEALSRAWSWCPWEKLDRSCSHLKKHLN